MLKTYLAYKIHQFNQVLSFCNESATIKALLGLIYGLTLLTLPILSIPLFLVTLVLLKIRRIYIVLPFVLGFIYCLISLANYASVLQNLNENIETTALVQTISASSIELSIDNVPGKVITRNNTFEKLELGDKVKLNGSIKEIDSDFKSYYQSVGVFLEFEGKLEFIEASSNDLVLVIRKSLGSQIHKYLSTNEAELLSGILIGTKSNLSEEFKNNLSNTSTSHIVSFSGFNLALVFILLTPLLRTRSRVLNNIIIILILFIVSIIAGNITAQRAFIMFSLVLIARTFGRRVNIFIVMLTTIAIILILNVFAIYSIGVVLSFGAILGLLIFSDKIAERLKYKNFISENASAFIAANIFTLPLIALTFGEISVVGIIVNILIAPFVGLITQAGFVATLLSYLNIEMLNIGLFKLLELLLKLVTFVINYFGVLSFSKIEGLGVIFPLILILILVIFSDFKSFKLKFY